MSFITQSLFINQIGSRLLKFKRKSSNLFNFRCIFCMDSEKNKSKARAYLYLRNGKFWYSCHNCQKTTNFETFIRTVDPGLYSEYLMALMDDTKGTPYLAKMALPYKLHPLKKVEGLTALTNLPKNHEAMAYVLARKIPKDYIKKLYWTEHFKALTNRLLPDKFDMKHGDEARLIIPFVDQKGDFFGYQGRTLNPHSDLRYITIIFNPMKPKLFGLDGIDFNRRYYVFEGPIDSMFVPNSIATAGGRLITELQTINANLDNAVVVVDNEPRNRDVMRGVKAAINLGFKVVIWPSNFSHKDINDAILSNVSAETIKDIIDKNTFSDLEASLHFERWKKS